MAIRPSASSVRAAIGGAVSWPTLTKRPSAIPRSHRPSVPHRATFLTRIYNVIHRLRAGHAVQCNQMLRDGNYCKLGRAPAWPLPLSRIRLRSRAVADRVLVECRTGQDRQRFRIDLARPPDVFAGIESITA